MKDKKSDIAETIYAILEFIKQFPHETTWQNAAVHELGHVMRNIAIEKNNNNIADMENDRRNDITAMKIVWDAWNSVKKEFVPKRIDIWGAIRDISELAAVSYSEAIAEAFSDVFTNSDKASPLSKEIVKNLHKETG